MSQLSYKDAGVDIHEGTRMVEKIKKFVKTTMRPEVLTGLGGFSSMVEIPSGIKNPVLVSGTDGVGTKLKFAFLAEKYDTVGIDLVAMCVNDIAVVGAEPLYFLDYFATGKLSASVGAEVVKGIAEGCRQAGAALVGGETAEMPDFYSDGEFDLAGFTTGIVDKEKIIDGSKIESGDIIIGLPSSGVHSNGYSLVRKVVLEKEGLKANDFIEELGLTVAEEFLKPTVIYVETVKKLLSEVEIKGMVHVTGGGFYENIPRVLPDSLAAIIDGEFQVPDVFKWLKERGNIEEKEMFTTFNCGIGYIVIVNEKDAKRVLETTDGVVVGHVAEKSDEDVIFNRKYFN